jgi:transcriptional regulator with XRE-family HTH domain
MTADDLRAWQKAQGHTYDTAAAALGVSRATFAAWLAGATAIPGPVPYACAALAAGLPPWTAG